MEGHARPGGTTSWCNFLKYQSYKSTDGTREYLFQIATKCTNLEFIEANGFWESKDEQFQAGIERLKELTNRCTLWQVDADEWWTKEQLERNENALRKTGSNVGSAKFHHVVGECEGGLLLAQGKWGSDSVNRVWLWKGEDFTSHEPPTMKGQRFPQVLPEKFLHFSYYFEKDVDFKAKYYKGHENIYKGWKELQTFKPSHFPCHIYKAFGRKSPIGRTNTTITRVMPGKETGMLV